MIIRKWDARTGIRCVNRYLQFIKDSGKKWEDIPPKRALIIMQAINRHQEEVKRRRKKRYFNHYIKLDGDRKLFMMRKEFKHKLKVKHRSRLTKQYIQVHKNIPKKDPRGIYRIDLLQSNLIFKTLLQDGKEEEINKKEINNRQIEEPNTKSVQEETTKDINI